MQSVAQVQNAVLFSRLIDKGHRCSDPIVRDCSAMTDPPIPRDGRVQPGPSAVDADPLMLEALRAMEQGFDRAAGLKPFGAVVAKAGLLLAKGINTCQLDRDPTAHAEINAIRAAARQLNSSDLTGCILYASAQPCPMCRAAAYHAGIQAIIYASTWSDYKDLFPDQDCHEAVSRIPDPSSHLSTNHHVEATKLWQQYRIQAGNHSDEGLNS